MDNGIRSLIVHLDGPDRAEERLIAARALALGHGARLVVAYAARPTLMLIPSAGEGAAFMAEAATKADEERLAGARAAFEACCRQPGLQAEWRELSSESAVYDFGRQALYADLMVLGQADPASDRIAAVPRDFPEAMLAASGRPALVIPYAGRPASSFATAAIAWKESPESARAVAAALPILRRAARVHVLSWGADGQAGQRQALTEYLGSHGIQAQWHDEGSEPALLGEMLLSRTADLSADLLVMGCYGHSRAREWILGGASRTLLQSMTLPVLMAH